MERPARMHLTPRLVLVFAVLACVFGWGQAVAEAAASAGHLSEPAPAAAVLAPSMPGHGAVADVGAAEQSPATQNHAGHGAGHGASHENSVSCMASSATSAFGVVGAPDVAALVVTAVPALTRVRESATPLVEQRAPSIATLCVQRT